MVPTLLHVTRAPPFLLLLSVCSFLIGFVFFVFAACDQNQRYFVVVATVVVCLALTYLASFIVWAVISHPRPPRPDIEVEAAPEAPQMLAIGPPIPPFLPIPPILPIPPPVPVRTYGMYSYDGDMMDYPP